MSKTIDLNYEPIITKIKNVLETWKNRGLTLIGKIQIVNTLIASLFVYKSAVLPLIPNKITQQIRKIVTDFIWNGRKPKINWNVLTALKINGGLGLADIQKRDQVQKISWVFKLRKNENLSKTSEEIIGHGMGNLFWECCLEKKDVDKIFRKGSDPFWFEVMKLWFDLVNSENNEMEDVGQHIIWYNSNIRIGGLPVFNKAFYEKGIIKVRDLVNENGELMSFDECRRKYGIEDFLSFHGLRSAIPINWKLSLKKRTEDEYIHYPNSVWKIKTKIAQTLYQRLKQNDHNSVTLCN